MRKSHCAQECSGVLLKSEEWSYCALTFMQELLEDPVVCADGYTYSRTAILQWLSGHSTSPMTNMTLSSRELRPNYTLRSAALEWQAARQA